MAPVIVAMYADLACPFAYVAHARWRRLRPEFAGRVAVKHASLALEYVNREATPKGTVEAETAELARDEPDLRYVPWSAPDSQWPVTLWPAFEAVKCAERQGLDQADDLAWAIRTALFAESRCVSMRHVLIDLALQVGLDIQRFTDDFDAGVTKPLVLDEARAGWERLSVNGSPTFVLPSGKQISSPGLPELEIDPRSGSVSVVEPAKCEPPCLDLYRAMFEEAARQRLS